MTLLFEHTSEGATDEQDVVQAVSGHGTPWTIVSKTGGATVKYDSAQAMHGTRSIRFQRFASTDSAYVRATLATAVARQQTRCYLRIPALPTAPLSFIVERSASGFMGTFSIGQPSSIDGKIYALHSTGAVVSGSGSPSALSLDTWYRLETAIEKGTGTTDGKMAYALYTGDGTTAIHTWSTTAANTGTLDPIETRWGLNGSSVVPDMIWIDDPAVGDGAAGWLGPTTVSAPTAVVNGQLVHLIDATGSTVAAGTITYSISQTSGTTTTPTLVAPGIWKVVPHATSTLIYDVTATGSLGGSDVESVTVPPLSSGTVTVRERRLVGGVLV